MTIRNVQGTYLAQGSTKFSDVNAYVLESSPYEVVFDVGAIEGSVLHIIGTRKGSRVMRRAFGSYVTDMLFDPIDDITADRIKNEIITAIGEWEDRIKVKEAVVLADIAGAQYYVRLVYFIPQLNRSAQLTFNLAKA